MARKKSEPPTPASAPGAGPLPTPGRYDPAHPVADLLARFHPRNPKVHADHQLATIRDSIRRLGWVKPVVVNVRTGMLVDGHGRLAVCKAEGWETAPALFGEWDEDQEREILAYLDAITAQAGIDESKLAELQKELTIGSEHLRDLLRTMEDDPFFREGLGSPRELLGQAPVAADPPPLAVPPKAAEPNPPRATPDGDHDPDEAPAVPTPAVVPESQVRMVQLFLSVAQLATFNDQIDALRRRFGTQTTTDTVLQAVAECAALEPAGE